jgi:hypothetical protein
MKYLLNLIWRTLILVGQARHGAWLARQGRIAEAKALYK